MPDKRKNYEEDFYTKDNIVAYTGNIDDNPTVYFQKEHSNGDITYGHITQAHKYDKVNIGKEKISTNKTYKLVNEVVDEDLVSKEYVNGKSFHTSRNPHKKVLPNDHKIKDKLAKAIENNPGIKKMYTKDYVQEQLEFIQQEDLKNQQNQLIELKDEIKEINHQLQEIRRHKPKTIVRLENELEAFEDDLIEEFEKVQDNINKQSQKDKPKLNFSEPLNKSAKLSSDQKAQLDSSSSQNKSQKTKKPLKV